MWLSSLFTWSPMLSLLFSREDQEGSPLDLFPILKKWNTSPRRCQRNLSKHCLSHPGLGLSTTATSGGLGASSCWHLDADGSAGATVKAANLFLLKRHNILLATMRQRFLICFIQLWWRFCSRYNYDFKHTNNILDEQIFLISSFFHVRESLWRAKESMCVCMHM